MIAIKNKVIIVTGASRGIGRAIAQLFARQGAKVVLSARKRRDLERVGGQLNKENKPTLVIPCDVTSEKQVRNLVRKTLQK